MKQIYLLVLFFLSFSVFAQDDLLDKACALKESFRYGEAIELLTRAPAGDLGDKGKRLLARLYFLNGNDARALDIFGSLQDATWQDLVYCGLVREAYGSDVLAVELYNKSLKIKENSIALYRLGKIYYHRGDYEKAADFFARTIAFDRSVRPAYYYLGETYLLRNDFVNAHNYLSQAKNFYPGNQAIQEQIEAAYKQLGKEYFADKKKEKEDRRRKVRLSAYCREEGAPRVKVGIAEGLEAIVFKSGENFTAGDGEVSFTGKPEHFYTVVPDGKRLALKDYAGGAVLRRFKAPLSVKGKTYPFYIFDITYGAGNFWHKQLDGLFRGDLEILLSPAGMTLVNDLSVEDYLYGVLPAEISPSSAPEALKAQAVAARTIAVKSIGRHKKEGFDVCAQVHCQVYGGMLAERASTTMAAQDTRGEILVYKNKPIEAFYHSNCGGCLRDNVFNSRQEFLKSKRDSADEALSFTPASEDDWFLNSPRDTFSYNDKSNYRWQRVFDAEDFAFLFARRLSLTEKFVLSDKGACGHYGRVEIDYPGDNAVLSKDLDIRDYFDGLRSSAFKLEVKLSPEHKPKFLIFWGAGFGHGAGLSQEGAARMGQLGYDYRAILKHYYGEADIEKQY